MSEGIPEHTDENGHGENPEDHCGHAHVNTWGDCCGIKIPSGIAASESLKHERGRATFRLIRLFIHCILY